MTAGCATFTTTHRVIYRVHNDTTVVRLATQPAAAACLTALFESVVGVTHYAYGCTASEKYFSCFA